MATRKKKGAASIRQRASHLRQRASIAKKRKAVRKKQTKYDPVTGPGSRPRTGWGGRALKGKAKNKAGQGFGTHKSRTRYGKYQQRINKLDKRASRLRK
jgi:hypothetical protein